MIQACVLVLRIINILKDSTHQFINKITLATGNRKLKLTCWTLLNVIFFFRKRALNHWLSCLKSKLLSIFFTMLSSEYHLCSLRLAHFMVRRYMEQFWAPPTAFVPGHANGLHVRCHSFPTSKSFTAREMGLLWFA